MDDDDRMSNSSGESERDNDQDEVMDDVDEPEQDPEPEPEPDAEADGEEDNNDDNNDDDDDDADNKNRDGDNDENNDGNAVKTESAGDTADASGAAPGEHGSTRQKSATPAPALRLRPTVRPEMLTASLYDIVPTMAAPQSTSINAISITPDMRYWMTGGSDGYIRKYDGPGTINGKLTLTVAQKHPFVDSVHKAGILMSYWENEEPTPPGRGEQEHVLSPVYSLAVHSDALWLLSGLESGGINLQSVRYDEGKRITCLQKHTNAVSVLTLAQDEKSVLSGGWDKNIFDWDLNTGQVKRSFDGNAGQLSAIELRPASGDPIPAEADEPLPSDTIATNNGAPPLNGAANGFSSSDLGSFNRTTSFAAAGGGGSGDAGASPAHESLFGGSDAGSLFGETAGEQPFGQDDDEYATGMDMVPTHEGGMDHSADMAMAGIGGSSSAAAADAKDAEKEPAPAVQPVGEDQVMADSQQDTQQTMMGSEAPSGSQTEVSSSAAWIKQEDGGAQNGTSSEQQAATNGASSSSHQQQQQPKGSQSPTLLTSSAPQAPFDATQVSPNTFLSAAMDGTIRLWDRRVAQPVSRITTRPGVPPWCMSACWSPDGNMIYAGRRNGTVEEFDVRKARRGWEPERVLKFPVGSGPVSALRPMMNGRHLVW